MRAGGHGRPTRPAGSDRAQTGVDFLVGMGVFLVTTGFVFGFVPGLLVPFQGGQSGPLVADRVADTLIDDYLVAAPGDPALDLDCTLAFFDVEAADGAGCPFDPTEPDLATRFGIDGRYHLNVTVERNVAGSAVRGRLCADAGGTVPCGPGTSALAVGEPVPDGEAWVAAATRLVTLDGQDAVIVVRLW